eukprot:TRINITY_DN20263_c0_g1_i1.p1 TRINITY_DN20263_c0_g1~~TRINITY_DN20263_c0_g1_i1.p1  ORF type:complete len:270 (+),score=32.58 TRINITY_DN20263_c0_g1_i1:87-896(+)
MSYGSHGLRLISNATYEPYGSGRDWFFLGDFYYRNGRRTPGPQDRWKAYNSKDMLREPLGRPKEHRFPKRMPDAGVLRSPSSGDRGCDAPTACPASEHIDRWRAFQVGPRRAAEAPSGYELPQGSSAPALGGKGKRGLQKSGSSPAVVKQDSRPALTTMQDLGRFQGFDDSQPSRAAKYRNHSERVPVLESGDQIGSAGGRWSTTYQDSLPKDFDASKLPSKYSRFSEAVPDEKPDPAGVTSRGARWKTSYQDFGRGYDINQLHQAAPS